MNKKLLTGTGVLLAVVLFFGLNILSKYTLDNARLDLTANRLYTLSDGSRNLLKNLQEPIRLRFFFSKSMANDLPQVATYADRVRELLGQFASLSNGKIKLEVIDPEPFSDAEDRAVQAGVQGIERDGRNFYFGMVGTNSVDAQEVVPFFQMEREEFLEYDLTKLIYALSAPKKPVIGILSTLPLQFGPGGMMAAMRGQSRPYAIMQQLRQFFEIKTLEGSIAKIDDSIGVLLLAQPRNLDKATLYAIDQFVMRGGRVIAFVDPHDESAAAMPDPMTGQPAPPGSDQSSNLPELFASWGVEFDPKQVVGDAGLAQKVQMGPRQVVDYIAWLAVPAENLSRTDVITGQLNGVNMASAGMLKAKPGATTQFTPLITSSDRAMPLPVEKVQTQPDPPGLLAAFKPSGERYVLAARITGPVKSAFPGGRPPVEKKDDEAKKDDAKPVEPDAHLAESKGPANIIVVADADFLEDRFWAQEQNLLGQRLIVPIAANADLLVNAIDNLAGSNDLISLRSRGRSLRPFERIESLRREASQAFTAREQALRKELQDTERKIADLQSKNQGGSGNTLLGAEEQSAIDGFRQQLVKTRQELRQVQRDLNKDIQRVETQVKFVNIGLMPILVGLFALVMAATRRKRRRQPVGKH